MKERGAVVNRLPEADVAKAREIGLAMYDDLAAETPAMGKLIGILKDYMRELGYIE